MSKVPRWLFLIITGGIGSVLLNLFHGKPKPDQKKPPAAAKAKVEPAPVVPVETKATTSSTETKKGGLKRKGKK